MFHVSPDVWDALAGSTEAETVAIAQYQGIARRLNVVQSGSITWDADADVQSTTRLHVMGMGDSLLPRAQTDLLAPYGQEIAVAREVNLRGRTVPIPLGVYRITGNDGGRSTVRRGVTMDWDVEVRLADRFRMLQRAKIVNPASPPDSSTMYDELRRLGLFPLQQSMPDVAVPADLVYEDRLSGVHDLCALTGGKPRMTRQGALTIRPTDRWLTETVPDFDFEGAIDWTDAQSDDFVNTVWTRSTNGEHSAYAINADDSDPLSVGRAGPVTYEHASPAYTSAAECQAGAETILARLRNRRSRAVTVRVDGRGALVDLSDVGWVRDPVQGRAVFGEVRRIVVPIGGDEPVELELIVAEVIA